MEFDLCFAIENSPTLKRLVLVQILELTVYQENTGYIRLTAFCWRGNEIEMRGSCLEAQKSVQTNLVIYV